MKVLSLFAIIVWLIGCGTDRPDPYTTRIDAKLKPEIEKWQEDCLLHLTKADCNTYGIESISIRSKLNGKNVIGQCEYRYEGMYKVKRIYISSEVPLNTYYSRALILHEMLHCRFDFQAHTDNGIMADTMYMSNYAMMENWPRLLEEAYALVK